MIYKLSDYSEDESELYNSFTLYAGYNFQGLLKLYLVLRLKEN